MKEYKYTINGNKYEVVVGDIKDNIATLTVNGETYTVEMEKQPEPEKKKPVVKAATPAAAASEDSGSANKAAVNKANAVKAPLPGVITDILVAEGDEVKAGDTVVVLEGNCHLREDWRKRDGRRCAHRHRVNSIILKRE